MFTIYVGINITASPQLKTFNKYQEMFYLREQLLSILLYANRHNHIKIFEIFIFNISFGAFTINPNVIPN